MTTGQIIVKELNGHSGSKIYLMRDSERLFVRKIGNVERNFERLKSLYQMGFKVPKLYFYDGTVLDMEYLQSQDICTFLKYNNTESVITFIADTINKFSESIYIKDYTEIYEQKLNFLDHDSSLQFSKKELIDKLPKKLPCSVYHGDMTLENILFVKDEFYMIDAATIEYDSYVFDIAKMRQDLECKWFLRNTDLRLDTKLQNIQDELRKKFELAFDDSLLIAMLLRVYLHTAPGTKEYYFIKANIEKLWNKIK